eukprot:TRINITY_DN20377_c0_g1_i1.p1 TRINITY_DN20377_c0_g1~~TRINITY_DN20377_c0_g1_i1.p1  ORF type:complete len:359 (+),score=112.22 TRINITY_DN20377_c0_g1_i1:89-1078(+)
MPAAKALAQRKPPPAGRLFTADTTPQSVVKYSRMVTGTPVDHSPLLRPITEVTREEIDALGPKKFKPRPTLQSGTQELFKAASRKASSFERKILPGIADQEYADAEAAFRRRDDHPRVGENPYSDGTDVRISSSCPVSALTGKVRSKLRFTDGGAVERCVSHIGRTCETVADVARQMGDARWVAKQKSLHGVCWTHVELLVRAICSQQEARDHCAALNRQGQLTPFPGERVYALAGDVRLSRGLGAAADPGFAVGGAGVKDPSSFGAYSWFHSDFGTDMDALAQAKRYKLMPGKSFTVAVNQGRVYTVTNCRVKRHQWRKKQPKPGHDA